MQINSPLVGERGYTSVVYWNEVIKTISNLLLFFFTKRIHAHKKHQYVKQTISTLLEVFMRAKNHCLCCFLFAYFCFSWLMFARECFCVREFFSWKKIDRFEIVLITSFRYITYAHYFIDKYMLVISCNFY